MKQYKIITKGEIKMKDAIIRDLAELINKNNMDTESNTPDFILAEMLYGFFESYKQANDKNINWHSEWKC